MYPLYKSKVPKSNCLHNVRSSKTLGGSNSTGKVYIDSSRVFNIKIHPHFILKSLSLKLR